VRYDWAAVVGRGAWLAGAVLLGYVLACNVTTGPFTCQENDDCVLQGVPGVCDGEGRCSYPDDACSSGYSYPAATPGVGGDCAPDPGTADASTGVFPMESTGAEGTTVGVGDDGTTEDGTTAQLDSAGSDESTSGGGQSESSSGAGSTSATTGGSTTGGPACPDTVGDSPSEAEVLGGCFMESGMGTIVDGDDVDWWQVGGADTCEDGEVEAFVKAETVLEVCLYGQCFGGNSAPIQCFEGEPELIDGFDACCGAGGVVADLNCGGGTSAVPYVLVRGEDAQCSAYSLLAGVAD